jgi:hypothetical protein
VKFLATGAAGSAWNGKAARLWDLRVALFTEKGGRGGRLPARLFDLSGQDQLLAFLLDVHCVGH